MRVVVAMSGGVDSSTAAALLQKEGYDVIGITMQIWPPQKREPGDNGGGCCGLGAAEDAKRVAYKLGIPHYVMNFRDIFDREVITDFCREYSRGRTPNPCVRCNQYIKFGTLLERAGELGADFIATGHHARIEASGDRTSYFLKKGSDPEKDQSYFLYPVTQEQLGRILMPVGNFTKGKIREMARELGLSVAAKPESQEICFIPDDDYPRFVKEYVPEAARPGPILDTRGKNLGSHQGIMFYTIGQRRGLGISAAEPQYVVAIEPERNALVVGGKEEVYGSELTASGVNWISGDSPEKTIAVKAKIRYRHPGADAEITPMGEDNYYVKFNEPQMAITPGQAVVFYDGDVVLGGGTIELVRK